MSVQCSVLKCNVCTFAVLLFWKFYWEFTSSVYLAKKYPFQYKSDMLICREWPKMQIVGENCHSLWEIEKKKTSSTCFSTDYNRNSIWKKDSWEHLRVTATKWLPSIPGKTRGKCVVFFFFFSFSTWINTCCWRQVSFKVYKEKKKTDVYRPSKWDWHMPGQKYVTFDLRQPGTLRQTGDSPHLHLKRHGHWRMAPVNIPTE